MPRFFIERPIFAWVIAIVIMLGGVFAIKTLPVEQYPEIAPPSVTVSASYPGASAEVLENSVTQIIEQSLTGIDYLRYFSSSSDSNGNMDITLTFEPEADADIAQAGGVLPLHQPGTAVAGVDQGLVPRRFETSVQALEGRARQVDLAADLDLAGGHSREPGRHAAGGPDLGGDVVAAPPVAAGCGPSELAVAVDEADRDAVDLGLHQEV